MEPSARLRPSPAAGTLPAPVCMPRGRAAKGAGGAASSHVKLPYTAPTLALHASLLLDAADRAHPFRGVWPDLRWSSQQAVHGFLATAAVRTLPAGEQCERGHEPFAGTAVGAPCLLARRRKCKAALQQIVPREPEYLHGAHWQVCNQRWGLQLRVPDECQRPARLEAVLQRFQGSGTKQQVAARRREMTHVLGPHPTRVKHRPWHWLQRVLCWWRNGPPSSLGKPGQPGKALLYNLEGSNLACHALCPGGEHALCLTPAHLQWGTPRDNAQHREDSKLERVQAMLDRFHYSSD